MEEGDCHRCLISDIDDRSVASGAPLRYLEYFRFKEQKHESSDAVRKTKILSESSFCL